MRAALGRALPAPRTTASDGSRIGICILIGSRSRRSVKAALNLEAAALVDDGATAAQGLHLGYNRGNDREADL
jgi:hypothetical protein